MSATSLPAATVRLSLQPRASRPALVLGDLGLEPFLEFLAASVPSAPVKLSTANIAKTREQVKRDGEMNRARSPAM